MEIIKEIKFMALIIPRKDIEGFFKKYPEAEPLLNNISDAYAQYRLQHGKQAFNNYVIVNQDEPYIENVWKVILAGEKSKLSTTKEEKRS